MTETPPSISPEIDRLIDGESQGMQDPALRPLMLDEFIGQGQGRANLETFIHAAGQPHE